MEVRGPVRNDFSAQKEGDGTEAIVEGERSTVWR